MTSVLMVLSAARFWTLSDGEKHPTGFWAEEFLVPYQQFTASGYEVTLATPQAKVPIVDQLSLGVAGGAPWTTKRYRRQLQALAHQLENPVDLHAVDILDYDLVFYPGGHGPMEDLAVDEISGQKLNQRLKSGKLLALLCHAPAALLATQSEHSVSAFAGRKLTGLSNREELLNLFARKAPWLLEDRLKQLGAEYSKGLIPLRPHVVVDGNLYTGQNPQSSKKLAQALIAALG
ncbi:dimethylallyltransferase [Glutamicibacter uratoxydans]|uniref:Dimethylallyltransferase n=1 Tax=Glutamicibacter uratoxydans TaxID=43667 RepID=A0A4Y4DHB2_GLUUR|nr:type 1 glutamine amidotransferase domain-containing protein [Glutamicibacter uratoxydans]GED04609.1 dimethylallyltransferase [Glutamicibacter uratoxydans]